MKEISNSVDELPPTDSLRSNYDFISTLVKLGNGVLYLLRLVAVMAPDEKRAQRGYTRRRAVLIGLFVRLGKLYKCLLDNICQEQGEITLIFVRLIFETKARLEYLMQAKSSSYRSFVVSSFRAEKEILQAMEEKKTQRALLSIEQRMIQSVRKAMAEARISRKELVKMKQWKLNGKDFKTILRNIGQENMYLYGFRTPSHTVHGDWADLLRSHLKKEGRFYKAKIEFDTPDPRALSPSSILVLDCTIKYVRRLQLDRDRVVTSLAYKLLKKLKEIERAHDVFLQQAITRQATGG